MLKKIIGILLGMGLFTLPVYAGQGDGGEAGAFLKMGAGARALALGKAYVALADDATASYWNPAGLTQLKGRNLYLMYGEPFDKISGIGYSLAGYAQPTTWGSIGASLIYLSVDGLEKANSNGPTGHEFGDKEMALLLSYGKEINPALSLGATLKGISQEIDSDKDSGFGLDVGLLYRPTTQLAKLKVGIVLQDLVRANIREEKMPLRLRLGVASYLLRDDRLRLSIGADLAADRSVKGHVGAEYEFLKNLSLRAGYSTDNEEITGGLGFKIKQFCLDYAYGSHNDLGATHRVSLGVKF